MKKYKPSNMEISDICREISLLIHAGVSLADGVYLLADEEKDRTKKSMLTDIAKSVEEGAFLADALCKTESFPDYMTDLIKVGEQTGRLENTLNALSVYYEQRDRTARQIKSTLTYPVILLLLMLVVIVVLLTKVLPVFNEIYESLGGQLTGIAGGLLAFGLALDEAMPVLCTVLGAVLVFFAIFALNSSFRNKITSAWNSRFGDRGLSRTMNNAKFAQALSMGFSSGLHMEDAIALAAELLKNNAAAAKRSEKLKELLEKEVNLAEALGETGFMSSSSCRLLVLGMRSGSGDSVMEDIARRMSEDSKEELERIISRIEPTLVLVTSVLVGIILLSVMLPLMNIMTTIG